MNSTIIKSLRIHSPFETWLQKLLNSCSKLNPIWSDCKLDCNLHMNIYIINCAWVSEAESRRFCNCMIFQMTMFQPQTGLLFFPSPLLSIPQHLITSRPLCLGFITYTLHLGLTLSCTLSPFTFSFSCKDLCNLYLKVL